MSNLVRTNTSSYFAFGKIHTKRSTLGSHKHIYWALKRVQADKRLTVSLTFLKTCRYVCMLECFTCCSMFVAGKQVVLLMSRVLQYYPAVTTQGPGNPPRPTYSLWNLDTLDRRNWLMAVFIIIYKVLSCA